jgi:hypothetical protein
MKNHAPTLLFLLLVACDQQSTTHEDIVDAARRCVDDGMTAQVRSNGAEWTVTCQRKDAAPL